MTFFAEYGRVYVRREFSYDLTSPLIGAGMLGNDLILFVIAAAAATGSMGVPVMLEAELFVDVDIFLLSYMRIQYTPM